MSAPLKLIVCKDKVARFSVSRCDACEAWTANAFDSDIGICSLGKGVRHAAEHCEQFEPIKSCSEGSRKNVTRNHIIQSMVNVFRFVAWRAARNLRR